MQEYTKEEHIEELERKRQRLLSESTPTRQYPQIGLLHKETDIQNTVTTTRL